MKKKLLSLFTATLIMLNLSVPAFAYGTNEAQRELAMERTIQAEIEQEEDRIFASVYRQLEAQDALDMMDIYKEIISPKIEAQVRLKYGDSVSSNARYASYTFNNGGILGYARSGGINVVNTFITAEVYRNELEPHILDVIKDDYFNGYIDRTLSEFLSSIGVSIGGWGVVYSYLSALQFAVDASAYRDIKEADDYAENISVSQYGGTERSSVLIGWDRYPLATIAADAQDVHVKYF